MIYRNELISLNSASFAKEFKKSFCFFLYNFAVGFHYDTRSARSLESKFAFLAVILAFLVNRCHIAFEIVVSRLTLPRYVVASGARETCLMRYEFILSFEADHLDFTLGFLAAYESLAIDVTVKHVCKVTKVPYIITFFISLLHLLASKAEIGNGS